MNPFQIRRKNISLLSIFNQRHTTEWASRLLSVSSPSSCCRCRSISLQSPIFQASFLSEHIPSLPSCLKSLWTPNANSVRHLIRHINSISPLIALIPLCNEFLCGVPSVQQGSELWCCYSHGLRKPFLLNNKLKRVDSTSARVICWATRCSVHCIMSRRYPSAPTAV